MKNTQNPSLWEHWVGPSFERFIRAVRDITDELHTQQQNYKNSLAAEQAKHAIDLKTKQEIHAKTLEDQQRSFAEALAAEQAKHAVDLKTKQEIHAKTLEDQQRSFAETSNEQQQYFMRQQEETLRNTKYQQELKLDLLGGFHYGGAKIENGVYSSSDEILTLKLNVESTKKEQELQSELLKLHSKFLNELAIGNQDAIADLRHMIEQNERETSMLKQKCTEFSQSLESAKKYFEISCSALDAKLKKHRNLDLNLNKIMKDVKEYKMSIQSKEERISHLENVIKYMDMKSFSSIEDYEHERIKAHEKLKEIQDDIISLKINAAEKHHILESILSTLDKFKPVLVEMQNQQLQAQQLTEIYQDPYESSFYNNFVQQLNALWLASAVVNTDLVACSKTGITANIGNTLNLLADYVPFLGGAVKLCGMLLVKLDSKIQKEKVNNLYNLVRSPLVIDNVAKRIAVDLLKSLEIDVNKLDHPQTLADKLYNILGVAIDNIENIINFAQSDKQTRERILLTQGGKLLLKTAASILQGAINRDQKSTEILLGKEGKKHAEIVATIIIAKIYNGEASLAEKANIDEDKATILEELLLDEYGIIEDEIKAQADIISNHVLEAGKTQLNISVSKDPEREREFVSDVSDVLLSKLYYRELLAKALADNNFRESLVQHLSIKFLAKGDVFKVAEDKKMKKLLVGLYDTKTISKIATDVLDHETFRTSLQGKQNSQSDLDDVSDISNVSSPTTSSKGKETLSQEIADAVLARGKKSCKVSESQDEELEKEFLAELAKFLRIASGNLLALSEQNADLKDDFIKQCATVLKKDGKIYAENGKLVIREELMDDGAEFFEPIIMQVKEKLKKQQYQDASGVNIEIRYINHIIYSDKNTMLQQDALLYEAGQIAGMDGINRLINLGEDADIARGIITATRDYGISQVLNMLIADIKTNPLTNVMVFNTDVANTNVNTNSSSIDITIPQNTSWVERYGSEDGTRSYGMGL